MINYFLYTIFSLGGSYIIYFLLLRKLKTFQFNRFFLLSSLLLCLVAPFLEFKIFESVPRIAEIPIKTFTDLDIGSENSDDLTLDTFESVSQSQRSPVLYIYLGITFFMMFRFLKNILQIYSLTRGEFERFGTLKLIKCKDSEMASSFFNYLFIQERQTLNAEDYLSVIKHESVHSKEMHTIDVILIELILCAFWCNPFVWLYRKAILRNHEYIADDRAVSSGIDIEKYSNTIINLGYKQHRVPLTSGFNFIQIKNRIIMLHQLKASVFSRTLKITSVLLLFTGIFVFSSCKDEFEDALIENSLRVVIDAGHGGKDSGELADDFKEKDIVLNISKQLALLSDHKIQLIMTRVDDTFSSLEDRISFINAQNADLVISLHCNAHNDKSTNGVEAYYFDKNDFKEKSYTYSKILVEKQMKLFSNSRGVKASNMLVLKEINSPGVILELGFITNENDKSILMNSENQKEIARSIFEGLIEIGNRK